MTDLQLWNTLVLSFAPVFHSPTFPVFAQILSAWIQCPGRKTITRLYDLIDPGHKKAHDAYHRLIREADWQAQYLWPILARLLIHFFYRFGIIPLDMDDTTFHKTGRKIAGAAWWRDAVRSTGTKVVHCFGLNILVLTLRIHPPWGGEPLGLPINLRIHFKGQKTLLDLADEMILETTSWFTDRQFEICADGFFATLMGRTYSSRIVLISRMRRDAALYELPPQKDPHTRGARRKKGQRLPAPEQMVKKIPEKKWKTESVTFRGKQKIRWVWSRPVLWYKVNPKLQVLLVICRDPDGKEADDFFCTTDVQVNPVHVLESYAGRWSIEDTFKNTKQSLGAETPQSWKKNGPERIAHLSFLLYSLIWFWYIQTQGTKKTWIEVPWYPLKKTPSFPDALAILRRAMWSEKIISTSEKLSKMKKIIASLIQVVARAA